MQQRGTSPSSSFRCDADFVEAARSFTLRSTHCGCPAASRRSVSVRALSMRSSGRSKGRAATEPTDMVFVDARHFTVP